MTTPTPSVRIDVRREFAACVAKMGGTVNDDDLAGRPDNKPTPEDWQEAKRELTESGPSGADPLDQIPVGKRWDPVPGSPPRKANNIPADDEQTIAQSLVESGIEEAEHEQMVEGTKESVRKDRELGDSGT